VRVCDQLEFLGQGIQVRSSRFFALPVLKAKLKYEQLAHVDRENMNRKTIGLLIAYYGLAVVVAVALILAFSPMPATRVTVDELVHNPATWVNQLIVVDGKLYGPVVFASASAELSPWNYLLFRPNETARNSTFFVGVQWTGSDEYNFENVRVSGTVRQGQQLDYIGPKGPVYSICYFIEAQTITRL
jgi:hypothetical protein